MKPGRLLWRWAAIALPSVAAAGPPIFESTDVFTAGQDGVCEYRIPALLTSNRGTLLAFCDARVSRPGDPPNKINLVMKRSFDAGRTWGPLRTLATNGAGAVADSCGLADRKTGTLWLFSVYAPPGVGSANAAPGLSGATFYYRAVRSDDDGASWSAPTDFTAMLKRPAWSAGSTGIGNGIQTRGGRLILPRYHADYVPPGARPAHSASFVAYSDDHGRTWRIGADVPRSDGTDECQVAELADGTLLCNLRGLAGNHRKVARSLDGGASWSPATEDPALVEPRCEGSLRVLTSLPAQDKNRLLFLNPASLTRRNMTVRLSYDDGRTWPVAMSLYSGPSAYSCLSVLNDLTVGCLYERGERTPYEKITFARFNVEWLTGGRDTLGTPPGGN